MSFLNGQRVLLVVPQFFGYELDIKQELVRLGAIVDLLPDRPFETSLMKALTKVRPGWVLPAADRLYACLLEEFAATNYDKVLVVNGQTLSKHMLQRLRASFPTAQYILYMWDSIANRAHVRDNLSQFDKIYTFDPRDATLYQMRLRPLFYCRGFEPTCSPNSVRYHISFVGTAHTDRFAVVDRLRKNLPNEINTFWYLYLQAPWVLQIYRWTRSDMRHAKSEDFHFVPLDKPTLQSVFSESHAILDIEHPQQFGLTMRTFETLGAGKKLVTTNIGVRDYEFYSRDNICVIDRSKPRIPSQFLESPFTPLSELMRRRYSIRGWIEELFE